MSKRALAVTGAIPTLTTGAVLYLYQPPWWLWVPVIATQWFTMIGAYNVGRRDVYADELKAVQSSGHGVQQSPNTQ